MNDASISVCGLCGEPLPEHEQMFRYHGYSGPCPKPPLPRDDIVTRLRREVAASEELPSRIGDSDIPTMREAADVIARLLQERDDAKADALRLHREKMAHVDALLKVRAAIKEKLAADDAMLAFLLVASAKELGEAEWDRQHWQVSERGRKATFGCTAALSDSAIPGVG